MIKTKKVGYVTLVIVLLSMACGISTSTTSRYDYTYLYDDNQKLISPSFKIFHQNKDSSTLYYHLQSDDILYGKVAGDSLLKARILVKYKVYEAKNKKTIIDSATFPLINFGENNEDRILQGRINIKVPQGSSYPLEVKFRDANKDLNVVYDLLLDKRDNNNEQYFLLKENDRVLTKPVISSKQNISLIKSELIEAEEFFIDNSTLVYPMTPPPFATNTEIYTELPVENSEKVSFENNRITLDYFTQVNRLRFVAKGKSGAFYFYHYYEGFPAVVEIEQLTSPTRYISTSNEYKKISSAVNAKKAIDDFWLGLAKEEDRAKKMIEEYYHRVEIANEYFTSYKEGWKTDRGIIYIIYGIPTAVYKNYSKETWVYGEENNILSVKFEFIKRDNIQSNNDFSLVRNSDYKSNWYRAVDMWRQAKIY